MPRLIIGHTTESSVKVWVRGTRRWPVAFVDVFDSNEKAVAPTKPLSLDESEFYTGVITWKGLKPNNQYCVKVAFGKSLKTAREERIREAYTEGSFRTFPDAVDHNFTFMLGSCNLHSLGVFEKPDKAWVQVSKFAKQNTARFMIHCGDQIYADIPFSPRPDFDHYRKKYLDAWEDCRPAQRVLTELPHYMILDDHEITNNFDHDMGRDDESVLLEAAMKVYYEFQHKHNPDTPSNDRRYYYSFSFGTAQFFVLDTRYRRESSAGQMIDKPQLTALKRWLTRHSSSLKFIVTSVPFVGQIRRPRKDKWCDKAFDHQRAEILKHIVERRIEKLVFLTGDMHTSYHAQMEITKGDLSCVVHELMSSPINQVTPNTKFEDKYDSPHKTIIDGLTIKTSIDPETFYGSHSNIMAVEVDAQKVIYRIYRTTKEEARIQCGEFIP